MISKTFVSALAAAALVLAQSNNKCSQTTITINSNADATNLASCTTLTGNVVIGNRTDERIQLNGPTTVTGDLSVLNNGNLVSFSSSSIRTIQGKFHLQNVTLLSTLAFSTLQETKDIQWQSLPALEKLTFGTPGVVKATTVVISDTFLNSLDGIDITSVDFMRIDNNKRLTSYTSKLGNLSTELQINANGQNLKVDMPNLIWAANLTIANVSSFTVPQLVKTNGSIRFDSNFLTDFQAPNLTETGGDVAFIGNAELTNISFPQLTLIGGSFSIMNNTKLERIDSLPKVRTISGAVKLRGNFSSVALPSLNDVKGAFDVQSTGNIKSSCDVFDKLAPSSGGQIQGLYNCSSNNARANEDTSPAGTGGGSGGKGGGSSAAGVTINIALLALSMVAGGIALL